MFSVSCERRRADMPESEDKTGFYRKSISWQTSNMWSCQINAQLCP